MLCSIPIPDIDADAEFDSARDRGEYFARPAQLATIRASGLPELTLLNWVRCNVDPQIKSLNGLTENGAELLIRELEGLRRAR